MPTMTELQNMKMPAISKALAIFNGIAIRMSDTTSEKAILGFPLMIAGFITSPGGIFNSLAGAVLPAIGMALAYAGGIAGMMTTTTELQKHHPKHFHPAAGGDYEATSGLSDSSPLRDWQRLGKLIGVGATVICMAAPSYFFADSPHRPADSSSSATEHQIHGMHTAQPVSRSRTADSYISSCSAKRAFS